MAPRIFARFLADENRAGRPRGVFFAKVVAVHARRIFQNPAGMLRLSAAGTNGAVPAPFRPVLLPELTPHTAEDDLPPVWLNGK